MLGIKKAAEELNINSETLGHWVKLETNPISCNQCGHKVSRYSKLKKHEKIHFTKDPIKEAQLKFSCDECSKAFVSKDGMKKHKHKHHNEQDHVKEFCHSRTGEKGEERFDRKYFFPCHLCSEMQKA